MSIERGFNFMRSYAIQLGIWIIFSSALEAAELKGRVVRTIFANSIRASGNPLSFGKKKPHRVFSDQSKLSRFRQRLDFDHKAPSTELEMSSVDVKLQMEDNYCYHYRGVDYVNRLGEFAERALVFFDRYRLSIPDPSCISIRTHILETGVVRFVRDKEPIKPITPKNLDRILKKRLISIDSVYQVEFGLDKDGIPILICLAVIQSDDSEVFDSIMLHFESQKSNDLLPLFVQLIDLFCCGERCNSLILKFNKVIMNDPEYINFTSNDTIHMVWNEDCQLE